MSVKEGTGSYGKPAVPRVLIASVGCPRAAMPPVRVKALFMRAWFRSLRSIKVRAAGLAYRGFGKGQTARASRWWLDRKHGFEMPDRPRIELFDGLSEEIVRELLAVAQVRPVGSEVILFREGSPARAVHVLASGFVRIAQTTE